MSELKAKFGLFASKLVQDAMASGLTWDESIVALGAEDCAAHARKRFEEALAQTVHVVAAAADMETLREAYRDIDVNALLANTNVRLFMSPEQQQDGTRDESPRLSFLQFSGARRHLRQRFKQN